jgi:hypothetical protein
MCRRMPEPLIAFCHASACDDQRRATGGKRLLAAQCFATAKAAVQAGQISFSAMSFSGRKQL